MKADKQFEQRLESMSKTELDNELLLLQKSEQVKSDQIAKTKDEKKIARLIDDLREIRNKINIINDKLSKLSYIEGPTINTMDFEEIIDINVDDMKPTEILTNIKQEILHRNFQPMNEIDIACMSKEEKLREKELCLRYQEVISGALSVIRDEKRKQELTASMEIITENIKKIDDFI
jgi:hypothetical protein